MDSIKILDKQFKLYLSKDQIQDRIKELAKTINNDYKDKNTIFLAVLNGSFMFASDLVKSIDLDVPIEFVKVSSYKGMESSGEIDSVIGISTDIEDKDVVVIEDIVDTGTTLNFLLDELKSFNPSSIKVATLIFKPKKFEKKYNIDYYGFDIPNEFIVGYGMDYEGYGRGLVSIYQVED